MVEGSVVIVSSGQAGTLVARSGESVTVLLRSGYLWQGPINQCRIPQDEQDLAACPIHVERVSPKPKKVR